MGWGTERREVGGHGALSPRCSEVSTNHSESLDPITAIPESTTLLR